MASRVESESKPAVEEQASVSANRQAVKKSGFFRRRFRLGERRPRVHLAKRASNALRWAVQGVAYSVAFSAAAAGSILLFRLLNKTKVYGLKNIPVEHENVLYCINHCSLLDNFAFEVAAYIPKVFFGRKYLPISLADRKNFFGDPKSRKFKDRVLSLLGSHFFRHLKAYPVDRKAGDMGQVEQWKELLKDNIVIVFPEGTRSRTGAIGRGKPGVGKLIYEAKPIVMPVHMTGTADVLGVGMKVPAVFRTIQVFVGKPMNLDAYLQAPLPEDRRERMLRYAEISDAVLEEIKHLNPAYHEDTPVPKDDDSSSSSCEDIDQVQL